MPRASTRPDLYARVTDAILADLETGVRPWTKPWSAGSRSGPVHRPLRACGQPYSGINVLLLWSEALARGFQTPTWMTFRQALALGAQVRRGARGATVVYASRFRRTVADDRGGEVEQAIPFLKAYTVFNIDEIEDLPETYRPLPNTPPDPPARLAHAQAFVAATGAEIRYSGDQAYYAPSSDRVQMPPAAAFPDPIDLYATLVHELTHWTGHPTRLDRDLGGRRGGDQAYAREELVAELGAAFLCADLGLELRPRRDHADYIGDWLQVLQNDRRFIFQAAAHAQRACDYLHGLQLDMSPAPPQ